MATIRIPEDTFEAFKSNVNALNKRAVKYNFPSTINFSVTSEDMINVNGQFHKVFLVEVDAVIPHIEGWEFVAKIEHTEHGNIVTSFGEDVAEEYKTANPVCEHCNTNRKRNFTFIIRNVESGEVKQIGKSCLSDYVKKDISKLVDWIESYHEIFEERDEDKELAVRSWYIDVNNYISIAIPMIKKFGFVPSNSESAIPSWIDVLDAALGKLKINFDIATEEEIENFKSFIDSKSNSSQFFWNVHVIILNGFCKIDKLAMLAGAVPGFISQKEKEQNTDTGEWVGNVDEKITTDLEIVDRHVVESFYGHNEMYVMKDSKGNQFVWFNSGKWKNLELKSQWKATGKVKEHKFYNGVKQTILKNVKMV